MKLKKKLVGYSDSDLKPILDAIKGLTPPRISKLQGSTDAGIIIISPPPDEAACEKNMPWANFHASMFFGQLLANTKLNHNNDFLVIPCVFQALATKKKTKAGMEAAAQKLLAVLVRKKKRLIVCAGPEPFNTVFREGSSSDPDMLIGHPLYMKEMGHSVILVMPDPTPLLNSGDRDDYNNYREFAIAQQARQQCVAKFQNTLPMFHRLVQTLKK